MICDHNVHTMRVIILQLCQFEYTLQVHYYSEELSTQHGYCDRSFALKRHRQLRVKDLPKVPTWLLQRDLNL